jgi:hypothetical protein
MIFSNEEEGKVSHRLRGVFPLNLYFGFNKAIKEIYCKH